MAPDVVLSAPDDLSARVGGELEPILNAEDDGLQASILWLGPGSKMKLPDPATGSGQYHLVVNGELDRDGNTDFNRLSCVFLTATESALAAKAGAGGLEMLVMQFPKGS